MSAEPQPYRCWVLDLPENAARDEHDQWKAGHWETEGQALKDTNECDPETRYRARMLPQPCFAVTCDGTGGEDLEDDDSGYLPHFATLAEAEAGARAYGGWTVLKDGRSLCPGCADEADGADPVTVPHPDQEPLWSET